MSKPSLIVNRLKIVKVKNRYKIYSLQIVNYGDSPEEGYSFYFERGSKIRIFYASVIDKKAGEIKNYTIEKKPGRDVVYISKKSVATSPIFFIERVTSRKASSFFFYNFRPSFSTITQFSELDIDLGRKLSISIPSGFEDNTKIRKKGSRYKIRYRRDADNSIDPSQSIFICENSPQALFKFLSQSYFSQWANLKSQVRAKFRLLYKGLKSIDRLIFMHEYFLKNAISLKKNILAKSTDIKKIYSVGDYVRNLAAVSSSFGYSNYSFVIPVFAYKKILIPFSMVGLKIEIGGRDYWFFPTSRYAKGGLIPEQFQGKKVVLISKRGQYSIARLPLMVGSNRIYAYNTFYLTGEGLKYRTSLTFTGLPAETIRNIINGWPRAVGHQKAASFLFGKNRLINSHFFRSIGRAIPHLPLKIKTGGLLTSAVAWDENSYRGFLKISLFSRIEKTQQKDISLNEKIMMYKKLRTACVESTIIKIPLGWEVKGMPLNKRIKNKYVDYKLSCVLRRGKIIKRPKRWSDADWQTWLKDNPGKKQDEIFAKRSFRLKPFKIGSHNISELDALMRIILRNKVEVHK